MMSRMKGAALLIVTAILILAAVSYFIFSAGYVRLNTRTASNQYMNIEAYNAAEAGLQYGMAYLQANSSTIIATASAGKINDTLSAVTLGNSSKFTVNYTNPTTSSYTLLTIKSTGTSSDGSSTRVVQQQVYQQTTSITYSAMSAGNMTFVGGSTLTNTVNNLNVETGGSFTINNGAYTVTSSGTSTTQGNIKSDVQQDVTSLQGLTESEFFQSVFGESEASAQAQATATGTYYNNSVSGGDYSQTLSGKTGVTIYINQSSVTLGQGVTIGSAASPVTLIVEGDLSIANGVTLYGFVYASGPSAGFNLAGGAVIYGGIASYGVMNISNGFKLTYETYPKIVGGSTSYSFVPGSWKDF